MASDPPHGRDHSQPSTHAGRVHPGSSLAHAPPNHQHEFWPNAPDGTHNASRLHPHVLATKKFCTATTHHGDGTGTTPPRTPVHTSPNLTDRRRVRISEDRNLAQQIQKDLQVAAKRITRRSQTEATANHPFCCYVDCKQTIPPSQPDALICVATQNLMHTTCAAPPQTNSTHQFCRSCHPSTAPTHQC